MVAIETQAQRTATIGVPAPRPAAETLHHGDGAQRRILLVSPDRLIRLAWASSIRARSTDRLDIGEVASSAAATSMIAATGSVDLVLIDLRAADPGADQFVGMLADDPMVHVVVIGAAVRVDQVQRALKAGAGGFLFAAPTSGAHRTALAAKVVAGETPVRTDPDNVDIANSDGVTCRLSRREIEILRHVADGEPNAVIAQSLGLSPFTVKSHMARIGRRLGTGERGHMVYLAMKAGVID